MKKIKWRIPLVAVLAVCVSIFPSAASASSDRVSQGEAQAIFNAGLQGGSALLFTSPGRGFAAAADDASIRPYFENGNHYCVLDWHVIGLFVIDTGSSLQEATASFEPLMLTFTLDGRALTTERTPVKAVAEPALLGADTAYSIQQGAIMSPSDLAVGSHTLVVTAFNPENPDDNGKLKTKFYVDPAGTGACI